MPEPTDDARAREIVRRRENELFTYANATKHVALEAIVAAMPAAEEESRE